MKTWLNLFKILLGNAIVFGLLLLIIESVFSFSEEAKQNRFTKILDRKLKEAHPQLGRTYIPNQTVRVKGQYGDKVLYSYDMTIDSQGRRLTPQAQDTKRSKYALFLGCSIVAGIGVPDNKTMPAHFAELVREYRVYNWGVGSWGPNNILALFENTNLAETVTEKSGVGVYVLFDFHVTRVVPSTATATWAMHSPYYRLDEQDELRFAGLFADTNPWPIPLYKFIQSFSVGRWLNLELPILSKDHYYKTFKIIEGIQKNFASQFPRGDFFVIIVSSTFPDYFYQWLKKAKIKHKNLEINFTKADYIPHDGHYSASGNNKLAFSISNFLQNQDKSKKKYDSNETN